MSDLSRWDAEAILDDLGYTDDVDARKTRAKRHPDVRSGYNRRVWADDHNYDADGDTDHNWKADGDRPW